MKEPLSEYLHFTRSERRGIFIFIFLILLALALPKLYAAFFLTEKEYDTTAFEQEIAEWQAQRYAADAERWQKDGDTDKKWKAGGNDNATEKESQNKAVSVNPGASFDPNTATKGDFLAMGLPERVTKTLLNYRSKGGRFYKKEDLKKVYGMKADWYESLAPFVDIKRKESTPQARRPLAENIPQSYETESDDLRPKGGTENVVVKLNAASQSDLQKVRGIGPYYAKRIVGFREKLGGYARLEQVAEIYGMPDSVYQKIRPSLRLENTEVRQININTASVEQLKAHPYIRWKTAKAIVKYRENNGPYANVDELSKNYAVSEELLAKLRPYLKAE